jgi:protein involved in polysaccharide export with SLBB domain
LTIMDAIAMAGGLTATTPYTQSQDLKRISVFEKANRNVSASAEVNTEINAGDLIVIGKGMNL